MVWASHKWMTKGWCGWTRAERVPIYRSTYSGRVFWYDGSDGISAKLDKISPSADVAVLKLDAPTPSNTTLLELDERSEATISGEPVVLIGYPTGIEGILAR